MTEITDLPPEGMELVGVALAGNSEGGEATWGLNLVFSPAGITVQHLPSQAESLLAWTGLDAIGCAERLDLPDGRDAAVLELISDGLSLRFLLPVDTVAPGQAAYLGKALPGWLARYKSAPVVVPAPVTPAPTPPDVVSAVGGDLPSPGSELTEPGSAAPADTVTGASLMADEQPPVSAPPSPTDGGGDPTSVGEATEQPARKRRRARVLLIVLLGAVIIAGAVSIVKTHDDSVGPAASRSAAVALATSINVRASDLAVGGGLATDAGSTPPEAVVSTRLKAAQSLAACIQQPSAVVEGWFGGTAFPGQIAAVTSRRFESGSAPTIQIFSTTRVMLSPAGARSLAAPLTAPKFATCFDQYQVAAVAVPITAQVQSVALSAPAGVEVSCYVTTFTLPTQQTEVVEDAFIVAGRTATVLQASAAGLSVPSTTFTSAYGAVVRRVAKPGS